jgi:circadian clock protein KaiB
MSVMRSRLDQRRSLKLRLFVAGDSPNSLAAVANLRAVLAGRREAYDLEIVDVLSETTVAEHAGIVITPALVRMEPSPECTLFGNLSDRAAVETALGLGELDDD